MESSGYSSKTLQKGSCLDEALRYADRPHCTVMATRDVNRRQSIFMSFRFILSNTARLAPFPYEDMHIQGSAKARRMPVMIAQADLDHLS